MSRQRDYDSTVARIAGNILSGVLTADCLDSVAVIGMQERVRQIVSGAVEVARIVVAETKATEPKAE